MVTVTAKPPYTIPYSLRAVRARIERLREKLTWRGVAFELNTNHVYRPGIIRPWTADTVKQFWHWGFKKPPKAKVRDILPSLPPLPRPSGWPRTRGECEETARPCPRALCTMHLAEFFIQTDRHDTRALGRLAASVERGNFRRLPYTCAFDVIDEHGPLTNKQLADLLQVSRNQVWRIAHEAIDHAAEVDPDVGVGLRRAYEYSATMAGDEQPEGLGLRPWIGKQGGSEDD